MRYAIYCGSSLGVDEIYAKSAVQLAQQIVNRKDEIVYGGASVGLMGVIADSVLEGGQRVIGVMPQALTDKELQHDGLSELYIVDSMQARKTKMAELAGSFIAMPGGVGTLEEIFEVWTAGQLGLHQKACAFYNVNGYFDELLEFAAIMVKKGFMKKLYLDKLVVESDPITLLERIADFTPPINKWD